MTPLRPHASTVAGAERTLVQLDGARCCRWPISPPQVPGADMLFCGAPREEGSPYCLGHRALSGARQRTEAERAADAARAERMGMAWSPGPKRRAG